MQVLDLFSGIGGFSLGLGWAGFRTAAFCEIDPFCQRVLHHHWPDIPIAGDIKRLSYRDGVLRDGDKEIYAGSIGLVAGGFPCQPYSQAGKRRGAADDRALWGEMRRLIAEVKPDWVLGENVVGFADMGLTSAIADLADMDYQIRVFDIPAIAVAAPSIRQRLWIVASHSPDPGGVRFGRGDRGERHGMAGRASAAGQQERGGIRTQTGVRAGGGATPDPQSQRGAGGLRGRESGMAGRRSEGQKEKGQEQSPGLAASAKRGDGLADPNRQPRGSRGAAGSCDIPGRGFRQGQQKRRHGIRTPASSGNGSGGAFARFADCKEPGDFFSHPKIPEPLLCRGDDGLSGRVERLRAIGNSVCPQIPEIIGRAIMEIEHGEK